MKDENFKTQMESTIDPIWELMQLQRKQSEIEMLDKELEEEKDKDKYFEKLILRHELSKDQTKRLLDHITERYRDYAESMDEVSRTINIIRKSNMELTETLENERIENKRNFDEFYDNFYRCILTNPRKTFQIALEQVERNHKTRDSSGDSRQWTYKFDFLARVRMAFKIIFG